MCLRSGTYAARTLPQSGKIPSICPLLATGLLKENVLGDLLEGRASNQLLAACSAYVVQQKGAQIWLGGSSNEPCTTWLLLATRSVAGWRSWLTREGADVVRDDITLPATPSRERNPECLAGYQLHPAQGGMPCYPVTVKALLDRYEQHTAHCVHCRQALEGFVRTTIRHRHWSGLQKAAQKLQQKAEQINLQRELSSMLPQFIFRSSAGDDLPCFCLKCIKLDVMGGSFVGWEITLGKRMLDLDGLQQCRKCVVQTNLVMGSSEEMGKSFHLRRQSSKVLLHMEPRKVHKDKKIVCGARRWATWCTGLDKSQLLLGGVGLLALVVDRFEQIAFIRKQLNESQQRKTNEKTIDALSFVHLRVLEEEGFAKEL
eukprot:3837492-Amphidinium_carterae.1